jgi:hypothetical protein
VLHTLIMFLEKADIEILFKYYRMK